MSLLDAIDRVESHSAQPFVAPLLSGSRSSVFVVQNGVPINFDVAPPSNPGWWYCDIKGKTFAKPEREAFPWELSEYFSPLPRFHVITTLQTDDQSWLVVPLNKADARQRGWPNAIPMTMHLTNANISPFDVVEAVSLGLGYMLFVNVWPGGNMLPLSIATRSKVFDEQTLSGVPRPFLQAAHMVLQFMEDQLREQKLEAARDRAKLKEASTEDRIKWHLDFIGARLVDWRRSGSDLLVTSDYNGLVHTFTVSGEARGVSAGICLDGTSGRHNLSSLVLAIQRARELHRYDLDESAWL